MPLQAMRKPFVTISLLLLIVALSCKKWEDPAPQDNPQINNPYCNDPEAVNYNWGFPGKPDNTTCIYASDLFAGTYRFKDTVYNATDDLFLSADSIDIEIKKVDKRQMHVTGLCAPGHVLLMTGVGMYNAYVDTTVGDSLSANVGQLFCRTQDTVTGGFTRDKVDSSLIYVMFTVVSDTGITIRRGRAYKK